MIKIIFLLLLSCPLLAQNDIQKKLIAEINTERQERGRAPLTYDQKYEQRCEEWAQKIVKGLQHSYRPNGAGEVISECYGTTELIIPNFMASKTHREVLMHKDCTRISLAVYEVPADTIRTNDGVEFKPKAFYTVIQTY